MKILHTTHSLHPNHGGPARSVPQLAIAQAKAGNEVIVWTAEPWRGHLADDTVGVPNTDIVDGTLGEIIQAGGFDIVHDHGVWQPFHRTVARVCARSDTPRVLSPRGMLAPWSMSHRRYRKALAWRLYQRSTVMNAHLLHATSPREKADLRALGYRGVIVESPNGVELPDKPLDQPGEVATDRKRTLLYLGRLNKEKGLIQLADAWAAHSLSDWTMLVIGPGDPGYVRQLEAHLVTLNIRDQWTLQPAIEGVAKWRALQSADIVILPSFSENFGITIAEAMACARPVIATSGTPWQRVVEEGCGWYGSHAELAGILASAMATDSQTLQAMGQRGRRWVEREFTWPAAASTLLSAYKQLLSGRPARSH